MDKEVRGKLNLPEEIKLYSSEKKKVFQNWEGNLERIQLELRR